MFEGSVVLTKFLELPGRQDLPEAEAGVESLAAPEDLLDRLDDVAAVRGGGAGLQAAEPRVQRHRGHALQRPAVEQVRQVPRPARGLSLAGQQSGQLPAGLPRFSDCFS